MSSYPKKEAQLLQVVHYVSWWWEMIRSDNVKLAQGKKATARGEENKKLYVRGNKVWRLVSLKPKQ